MTLDELGGHEITSRSTINHNRGGRGSEGASKFDEYGLLMGKAAKVVHIVQVWWGKWKGGGGCKGGCRKRV